jgi:hypothetical protein
MLCSRARDEVSRFIWPTFDSIQKALYKNPKLQIKYTGSASAAPTSANVQTGHAKTAAIVRIAQAVGILRAQCSAPDPLVQAAAELEYLSAFLNLAIQNTEHEAAKLPTRRAEAFRAVAAGAAAGSSLGRAPSLLGAQERLTDPLVPITQAITSPEITALHTFVNDATTGDSPATAFARLVKTLLAGPAEHKEYKLGREPTAADNTAAPDGFLPLIKFGKMEDAKALDRQIMGALRDMEAAPAAGAGAAAAAAAAGPAAGSTEAVLAALAGSRTLAGPSLEAAKAAAVERARAEAAARRTVFEGSVATIAGSWVPKTGAASRPAETVKSRLVNQFKAYVGEELASSIMTTRFVATETNAQALADAVVAQLGGVEDNGLRKELFDAFTPLLATARSKGDGPAESALQELQNKFRAVVRGGARTRRRRHAKKLRATHRRRRATRRRHTKKTKAKATRRR